MSKSFKCSLGIHKYQKFMGYQNVGGGKFRQQYKCIHCDHIMEKIA
ncbi:MAG: hypothetical protein ABIJ92_00820 [Candidatus Aenigmatarchaeota archaeon]